MLHVADTITPMRKSTHDDWVSAFSGEYSHFLQFLHYAATMNEHLKFLDTEKEASTSNVAQCQYVTPAEKVCWHISTAADDFFSI